MALKDKIISEIRQKVEEFESNMSNRLHEFNEWSDIFRVRAPSRHSSGGHKFSNPRLTEMMRAVNALATLEYRMLTSQDPYFEAVPMQLGHDRESIKKLEETLKTQLFLSEHKKNLLKALYSKILFGTVIVEEQYRVAGVNAEGRRFPITTFQPRPMVGVAYDRYTYDIELANWLTTSDVMSHAQLMRLADETGEVGTPWNKAEIENAVKEMAADDTTNIYVKNRLERAGFFREASSKDISEILMYYGKLDTMNDGIEYVCALVNRKFMIRFHANNFQHGRRPFRVAKHIDFELHPTGLGLGKLLSKQHRSMDANRQKVQDLITFATYSPWLKDRFANINANDLKLRPMQVIETDNLNAMKPLIPELRGADAGLKLEDRLIAEFRSASGATDTLQAIVTEATASEVTLAQNEAVRNISVKAEMAGEELVRKHLEIMHSNNRQNINEPLNVNIGGLPDIVYPIDLQVDVDFRNKITTDKDYKPQRIKTLLELMQILTSIRNQHPGMGNINIVPFAMELAGSLGINPQDIIQEAAPAPIQMPDQFAAQLPPQVPGAGGQAATEETVQTPIGPVLGSP